MLSLNMVDIKFSSLSDTPKDKYGNYRDPDRNSETLRRYHIQLWSKNLNSRHFFGLNRYSDGRMVHRSGSKEFVLSSDSIGHTYRKVSEMKKIMEEISLEEIDSFLNLCTTIGGYTIFPAKKVNNQNTINQSRGLNQKIYDRWDLTLECIRLYYSDLENPLSKTLSNYNSFFELFGDFKGYVQFFLMQDLVTSDYSSINFYLPHRRFERKPIPKNITEYRTYMRNVKSFISKRNLRILKYCEST